MTADSGTTRRGKIDLTEEAGVGDERAGGALEGLGEVAPAEQPGEVEKHWRQPVGRNFGDLAEDHRKDERREQRLEDEPRGPKDRSACIWRRSRDGPAEIEGRDSARRRPDSDETIRGWA